MTLRPWMVAVLLLLAGLIGGAAAIGVQALRPPPGDVRGYLLAHPEVLTEAMQVLRDRETGKLVATHRAAILTPFPGAVGGNPSGDVTVVAYMDYACGFCRASLPAIDRLTRRDRGVRIVYRELPVLSAESRVAAAWSLAAAEQGRFMPFHTALYAAGALSRESISRAAALAKLDQERAARIAASPAVAAEIDRNVKLAGELGMTGTPSWVIGPRVASGALGDDELADAVRAARRRG